MFLLTVLSAQLTLCLFTKLSPVATIVALRACAHASVCVLCGDNAKFPWLNGGDACGDACGQLSLCIVRVCLCVCLN